MRTTQVEVCRCSGSMSSTERKRADLAARSALRQGAHDEGIGDNTPESTMQDQLELDNQNEVTFPNISFTMTKAP